MALYKRLGLYMSAGCLAAPLTQTMLSPTVFATGGKIYVLVGWAGAMCGLVAGLFAKPLAGKSDAARLADTLPEGPKDRAEDKPAEEKKP